MINKGVNWIGPSHDEVELGNSFNYMNEKTWISENSITPSSCDVYQGRFDHAIQGVQLIIRKLH